MNLSNDLSRTMLKVGLEEVPSSTTYRAQQLKAMSEAVKSLPPQYQAAVLPFMVGLMDVPYRREVVSAIRSASAQESPEQVEQRIQQAVSEALAKSGADLKSRELELKYNPDRMAAGRARLASPIIDRASELEAAGATVAMHVIANAAAAGGD